MSYPQLHPITLAFAHLVPHYPLALHHFVPPYETLLPVLSLGPLIVALVVTPVMASALVVSPEVIVLSGDEYDDLDDDHNDDHDDDHDDGHDIGPDDFDDEDSEEPSFEDDPEE
ncbi:hypothetical protein GUJ93_ZPchr0002g24129 [Zizania palustris]|uniref:Uncharacterized protein n=1 Tax=Zizania palustris TaxID=103762 RepID=A0A8J5SRT3_ZIZPA|nr:hypothetical protein GUJ93_ZPchr0002g24129 [Zizania palustris]